MKNNHPRVQPRFTGLLGLFWLASASAQPGLTALILDHPAPQEGAGFGGALVGVGDVSGDGVPDLLVGNPSQDVGGNEDQGQAFVFSGADGSLLRILNDPPPSSGFGVDVDVQQR
ncbi:MAG: integrin alpha [Acidimicrobiia bacterium]